MEVIEQGVLKELGLAAHLGGAYVEDGHENEHSDDQWDEPVSYTHLTLPTTEAV